jgi:hypothetical protein
VLGPYVRGQLALHRVDLRDDGARVLDMIHALIATAPGEVLEKLDKELVMKGARAYPDRDSWGVLPEHQRMSGGLMDPPVTGRKV